jgi:hypothetical protein
VDQIRAATAAAKQAETDFKQAKQVHRDKVGAYKQLDYRGEGVRVTHGCSRRTSRGSDRAPLQDTSLLRGQPEPETCRAASHVATFITDLDQWTEDEKLASWRRASIAMLELEARREGECGRGRVARFGKSDNRIIRQAILLALPKLATRPARVAW